MKLSKMRARYAVLLAISTTLTCSGCQLLQVASAGAGAVSSYYSYKASKVEPVAVTTISKDCLWYSYITVPQLDRLTATSELTDQIKVNNKLAVTHCSAIKEAWCRDRPGHQDCH